MMVKAHLKMEHISPMIRWFKNNKVLAIWIVFIVMIPVTPTTTMVKAKEKRRRNKVKGI